MEEKGGFHKEGPKYADAGKEKSGMPKKRRIGIYVLNTTSGRAWKIQDERRHWHMKTKAGPLNTKWGYVESGYMWLYTRSFYTLCVTVKIVSCFSVFC